MSTNDRSSSSRPASRLRPCLLFVAALLATGPLDLRAQRAAVGASDASADARGDLHLAAASAPGLGELWELRSSGARPSALLLATGATGVTGATSRRRAAPWDLFLRGERERLLVLGPASGHASGHEPRHASGESFVLRVPRDPALEGVELAAQAIRVDRAGVEVSNVLRAIVGSGAPRGTSFLSSGPELPATDRFRILSCSLGCTGSSGSQVSCTITHIHVNEELRIAFSQAVSLPSVNLASFRIVEVRTGQTPSGVFYLDPRDPRVLVFQPSISFDSAGNPIFGLDANETYQLLIPGTELDPFGPYVTSVEGLSVGNRLLCTVVASLGVLDPVPGPPSVFATVRKYKLNDRDPLLTERVPLNGATGVVFGSDVTLFFEDVMNPATLLDPLTGTSNSIAIGLSPDPVTAPIAGAFSISIDIVAKTTTVTWLPNGSLPARSTIQVDIAPSIADLAGNLLSNPGSQSFSTAPLTRVQ